MHNLKRLFSFYDSYDNYKSYLLNDLLINNNLEYVHIENYESSSNIIRSMELSGNIANLPYLSIYIYIFIQD